MPEPLFDVPQPGDQAKAIAESALGVLSLIAAFGFHGSNRAELRAYVKAGREALSIADPEPQVTRTEWAARANYYDGTAKHQIGSDREHAELMADSMTTHLDSLNEPTRRAGGVESVDLVSRSVTVEDDGTQIIRPWRVERPGTACAPNSREVPGA